MHPEFFLGFSLGACPPRIMVNNHRCHVLPSVTIEVEVFSNWFADFFGLDGRTVVVDSSAEVSRFSNVLLLTNPATDDINAVICLTGKIAQDFIEH